MKIRALLMVCWVSWVMSLSAAAKVPDGEGVAITVYNDNFAVVKERRDMAFEAGVNTVKFTDVAALIDPTSVNFLCLSDAAAVSILEQNYEYDLVNTASLLRRYIDQPVRLMTKGSGASGSGMVVGVLKAAMGNDLIIQTDSGAMEIISRGAVQSINLVKMPEDLVTKPTLVWLANADKKARQLCQVTYTTDGINWQADYTAILNETDDKLDFSGWVTVDNKSGAGYKDATLKLIAGDVRRVVSAPQSARYDRLYKTMSIAEDKAGFEEKSFMEYHMYTLGRTSTVNNNQVKQIEFVELVQDVPVDKKFVYELSVHHWKSKDKVQVKLEFDNTEENQLGIALPKGKVRVLKKDPADDSLEFVGEDEIDHTPKKEKLSLYIGDAFDIVCEPKVINSKVGDGYQILTRQVEVRNRKDTPVTVYVDEIIPKHRNWRIENKNMDYVKKDAYTVRFPVNVGADSKVTLEYRIAQTW